MKPNQPDTTASQSAARSMTRAEMISCLRHVHGYWSTPNISPGQIEELEQQNLIQRAPTDICAIRLTEKGAAAKQSAPLRPTKD